MTQEQIDSAMKKLVGEIKQQDIKSQMLGLVKGMKEEEVKSQMLELVKGIKEEELKSQMIGLIKAKAKESNLLDYTAKPKVSGNVTYTSQVVGGDVTKFAGEAKSQQDVKMMQNEWAKTINSNLSGFNHRLLPIQELVKHFNQAFADDMQKALLKAGDANLKKGGSKYSEDV